MRGLIRQLMALAAGFLDSDKDGKVEIADIPGALAHAAALQARGNAMASAGVALVQAIRGAAREESLTSGGQPITAEEVEAAWNKAKQPFTTAADEARADLAKPVGE